MAKIVRVGHKTKSFLLFFHVDAAAKPINMSIILECFFNNWLQTGELNESIDDLSKKMCNLAG